MQDDGEAYLPLLTIALNLTIHSGIQGAVASANAIFNVDAAIDSLVLTVAHIFQFSVSRDVKFARGLPSRWLTLSSGNNLPRSSEESFRQRSIFKKTIRKHSFQCPQ